MKIKKALNKALKKFAAALTAKYNNKKVLLWLCLVGEVSDEPITKGISMDITLKKPIKPGFKRSLELVPDEEIDQGADGSFARTEVVEGDSSAPQVRPESTKNSLKLWIMGDGALGAKKVKVTADAHVGPSEVPLAVNVNYEVAHKDATEFSGVNEGDPSTDEPI